MAASRSLLSLTNSLRLGSATPSTISRCPISVQSRSLHRSITPPRIPPPTPFIPDATAFLTVIGRGLSKHASKIESWDALFSLTSPQLAELGVEPPRARRYLLRWRDKFRNGQFGIGGDLRQVANGVGEVRLMEVPIASNASTEAAGAKATITRGPGMMKRIINVDPESLPLSDTDLRRAPRVAGLTIKNSHTIHGSHVELKKGSNGNVALIKVKEGLWEHRRGHKVDGGERRKAEVRAKRRAAERKASRA